MTAACVLGVAVALIQECSESDLDHVRTPTPYHNRSVADGFQDVLAALATPTLAPVVTSTPLPGPTAVAEPRAIEPTRSVPAVANTEAARFSRGYLDYGGRADWLAHFVNDVIPGCENKGYGWVWHPEASAYVSVAQFDSGSWATASANTGLSDPWDLYHVGANVAQWSNAINHPGSSGGWPHCWWVGAVPQ